MSPTGPALHPASGVRAAGAVAEAAAAPQQLMGRAEVALRQAHSVARHVLETLSLYARRLVCATVTTIARLHASLCQHSHKETVITIQGQVLLHTAGPPLSKAHMGITTFCCRSRGPPASTLAHRLAVMCPALARWPQGPHRHAILNPVRTCCLTGPIACLIPGTPCSAPSSPMDPRPCPPLGQPYTRPAV